jgi:hypothetical protein
MLNTPFSVNKSALLTAISWLDSRKIFTFVFFPLFLHNLLRPFFLLWCLRCQLPTEPSATDIYQETNKVLNPLFSSTGDRSSKLLWMCKHSTQWDSEQSILCYKQWMMQLQCMSTEQVGVQELCSFLCKSKHDCSYLHFLQYIHTTYNMSKHNMFTIQPATISNH